MLDSPVRDCRLHGQSETTLFAEKRDSMPIPGRTKDMGAMQTTLPSAVVQSLGNFAGTEQSMPLEAVLTPFSGMFTVRPGRNDVLVHRINTPDAKPWRCNPRPLSHHKRVLLIKHWTRCPALEPCDPRKVQGLTINTGTKERQYGTPLCELLQARRGHGERFLSCASNIEYKLRAWKSEVLRHCRLLWVPANLS